MRSQQELVLSLDQLVEQLKADGFDLNLNQTILAVTTELIGQKAKDMVKQRFRDYSMSDLFELGTIVHKRMEAKREDTKKLMEEPAKKKSQKPSPHRIN